MRHKTCIPRNSTSYCFKLLGSKIIKFVESSCYRNHRRSDRISSPFMTVNLSYLVLFWTNKIAFIETQDWMKAMPGVEFFISLLPTSVDLQERVSGSKIWPHGGNVRVLDRLTERYNQLKAGSQWVERSYLASRYTDATSFWLELRLHFRGGASSRYN